MPCAFSSWTLRPSSARSCCQSGEGPFVAGCIAILLTSGARRSPSSSGSAERLLHADQRFTVPSAIGQKRTEAEMLVQEARDHVFGLYSERQLSNTSIYCQAFGLGEQPSSDPHAAVVRMRAEVVDHCRSRWEQRGFLGVVLPDCLDSPNEDIIMPGQQDCAPACPACLECWFEMPFDHLPHLIGCL